jgi:hypothetical protein
MLFRGGLMLQKMWQSVTNIADIPEDRDLRLAVENGDGMHELVFPCRHRDGRWVDARTGRTVDVRPTHWQEWSQS